MASKTIFPISRVHQPLAVKLDLENNVVQDARCTGILFRGFEIMLQGRSPMDAPFFTQRICGICSAAHAIAAVLALEEAYRLAPTSNGRLLRNLIFGAEFLHNNLTHFYLLVFPGFVKGPEMHPFIPYPKDLRLPETVNKKMMDHYWQGLEYAALAHQMLAIFGAKMPHLQTLYPTGVSVPPDGMKISTFRSMLAKIHSFISDVMIPDSYLLGDYYPECYELGKSSGNFISYGLFEGKDFPAGIINSYDQKEPLDRRKISQSITYSWYAEESSGPPEKTRTVPDKEKKNAYTWVKAPRYDGRPFETGALARGWISGAYRRGGGTMDRIVARSLETKKIAQLMETWLDQIEPQAPSLTEFQTKASGQGVGLTDAMRGALGHWLKIDQGRIAHYQIITPTAWNFSPRDEKGVRGPVEQALIGTELDPKNEAAEIGRIIRSFDPCFTCAVH
ncbi:nickel-dependent hydrogenase large subunit [Candidatus Formimonas warabiya]|uniref:Nickel-dependent hydrogenase large subunit n=1 Tax=Formimonas warabiya TaxID=1761012 RepID=A0A3G1KUQ5_FORW1|nr:nickel-dependent hydrogenase large subunit [Candidatus Formimonas warabiya]ATW26208.1 hypothetical protein DCMF_16825 [Candidatus Formimonas warabiya]